MSIKMRLTQNLLDALQLDPDEVQVAGDRAEARGGDVPGQLLVTGAISEAELLEKLAELSGHDAADPADYGRVDQDAFETIDADVLREYAIIPFRKHRRSLAVFVVEPLDDDVVDMLAERYSVTLSQVIWPRLRYEEALHALLDEPQAEWIQPYFMRTEHRVGFAESARKTQALGSLDSGSLDSGSSNASSVGSEPIELDELGVGWSREQTLDFLSRCYDRDALLHVLLGFSSRWLDDRMVLVLGHERAQPYLIAGWPELADEYRDLQNLRRIKIEVPADAVLFDEEQIGHSTAEMPEDVGLGKLFVELMLFPPDNLLVQTVRIGRRPSMAVIGSPRGVSAAVDALEEVARAVGDQLEEIVRLAKAKQLPPPEERIPPLPNPDDAIFENEEDEEDEEFDERPAVPGLAEASASAPQDEPDTPGATAFGIPFADEAGPTWGKSQQRSAVEVSSPGVGEDSSVSIIAPVDIDEDASEASETSETDGGDVRATMSGGFSVVEIQGDEASEPGEPSEVSEAGEAGEASEASEVSEASEASEAGEDAKSAVPMAQILRPVSLKKGRKKAKESPSSERQPEDPEPRVSETNLYIKQPNLEIGGYPSIEIEGVVEDDEPVELGEESSSFEGDLDETAKRLDSAEPHEAFVAAEQLAGFGERAMKLLEDRFPGKLMVDRYQHTDDTLPPVYEHGPVLAALAAAGDLAVPVARSFLSHTSVELRFYATFLFTRLPIADALDDLIPRLFDRDQQTRSIAKKLVLSNQHRDWFDEHLLPVLYDAVAVAGEELRVEVAADLLGAVREREAVPLLIESLSRVHGRIKDHVHAALRTITYKDFVPSTTEWKNWWVDAEEQQRTDWLVAALNSNSAEIRELAFREIQEFDGLKLNYHPDQPSKLRGRAQDELRQWLQNRG